ncbi:hypothetical protein PR003_g26739 [Phytophthora rubi]|uniref:Uncharacterized protein n=1 Tax=Phytophthora rubi TaxID=129364 RepID=A0A6A4CD49_9STRA|nr:hypothetical protein PR003_g26739 [Phytophthora rubi]
MAGQDLGEDNYAVEQEPDLIVQTLTADLETLKQNIMQKEGQGEGAAEREEDAADGEEAVSCCHRDDGDATRDRIMFSWLVLRERA